nr:NADH dehydrogenase subunit 4L [Candidula unifasciata unifasciata]
MMVVSYSVVFAVMVLTLLLVGSLFYNKRHIMSILLCLEFLVFMFLLVVFYVSMFYFGNLSLFVATLCFAASGAAIGLTLLVAFSRLYGNDYIANLYYEKNSRSWKAFKLT